MKKVSVAFLVIGLIIISVGLILAEDAKDDIVVYKSCKYCGMDRGTYNISRMLIGYDDGTAAAFCSMRCAAVDLANSIEKAPKVIHVGDFNGKQLIDAEKATWVVGGSKPGVMSKRGKWAFADKMDAELFRKTNGGQLATFEEAVNMAFEDMYDDTKAIRDRRKMKRMKIREQRPGAGR